MQGLAVSAQCGSAVARRIAHRGQLALTATLAAGVLVACGGGSGVDSGGTGMPVTLAQGQISGFGSVVVAGVHYDETQASITDADGRALTAADLKLGMQTTIEAGAVVDTGTLLTATARTVQIGEQLRGPISAIDSVACSATVLGQRVVAVATTVVDDNLPAPTTTCRLSGLSAGQLLTVHGTWDTAQARLVATRLELAASTTAYVLSGPVAAYAPGSASLTIGSLTVSLAELDASSLPATLPVGGIARVKLRTTPVNGQWSAIALANATLAVTDAEEIELEGRVTSYTSSQQFSVDGVPVDASTATFSGTTGSLALGVKVEVEGSASGGVVIARQVKVEADDDVSFEPVEVEGRITSVNPTAQTFVVRDVTVSYAESPTLEHGTLADLAVDVKVSVKGELSSTGLVLVATKIEFED